MRFSTFAFVLAAASLASAAPAQAPESPQAAALFTPDAFRAHVTYLADDLLEGRDTGTRGYDLAALYVATQLQALGLEAPKGSGWLQQVPFLGYQLADKPAALTVGGRRFAHREQVLVTPSPETGPVSVEAPAVFVGYGLHAPGLGLNDYQGLDVRGKVVVMLGGTPKGLRSDVAAHLNSDKRRLAASRGAVGIIYLRSRAESERRPWERLVANAGGEPALTWIGPDEQPFTGSPGVRFRVTLDTPAAEALFAGARRSFAKVLDDVAKGRKPRGFALRPTVRLEMESEGSRLASPNVLGVLPGSDPALAGEYVLLMAHLDGLGVHDRSGEDDIHNGAMDNATGVSTLIEVARAMAASPDRPKRPILFAAVTAEEDGLLGAQYLARNLPVDGKVVGVVNLDMPVLLYDFTDVIAFGAEHSTMGAAVARAGAGMGVALAEDPLPQEGLFTRSDHYRFVQEGIPAVFLMTGFSNGGKEKFTGFLSTYYHKPTDDLNLPIDWQAGAKFARINYEIAREIADAPEAPLWYADSFFGSALAPGAPKAPRR